MLRSLFILMLVAFMAAVGLYYENDAESRASLEAGTDNVLVAATAVKNVSKPERSSDVECETLNLSGNSTESQGTNDTRNCEMDAETIKP